MSLTDGSSSRDLVNYEIVLRGPNGMFQVAEQDSAVVLVNEEGKVIESRLYDDRDFRIIQMFKAGLRHTGIGSF